MKTITRGLLVSVTASIAVPCFSQTVSPGSGREMHVGSSKAPFVKMAGAEEGERDVREKRGAGQSSRGSDGTGLKRSTLEEIVVTAQKREERLIDVPMSITAVSADQIQEARISNTLDLSFVAPGLAVAETGPGRQIIVVRGLSSERGSSSLTGLYLDEMPVSGAQDGFVQSYIDLRTIDLERVEVLKGPQGTLFGEGAVGGAIRFITKDPELSRYGGSVNTSFYSTDDGGGSTEVGAVANLPIKSDALGVRIAGVYENKSGWIDQPSIGRSNVNDNEVYNVRVKTLWVPTSQLEVRGSAVVHRNEGGGSNIVNQEPRDSSNFLQVRALNAETGLFDRTSPTDFEDEYELYNLAANYSFGAAELLSSTSLGETESHQSFTQLTGTLPVPELELLVRDYRQKARIASQEVRLTSLGTGRFQWTIGAFYKDAKITQSFPKGVDNVLFNGAIANTRVQLGSETTQESKSVAEYADVSFALTERLKIGGGLRYFDDERRTFGRASYVAPPRPTQTADFNALTYRVFVAYEIAENLNVYATVGDGFRSGGFNGTNVVQLGGPETFEPEYVQSYEIGMKTILFGSRVSFDLATFYGEYRDMQENSILSSSSGVTAAYTANDQEAELRGAEAALTWRATDGLTLGISGDVIDTEITRRAGASPFDVGDPINFVPEYKVSANAGYRLSWFGAVPGLFRAEFNQQGKSFSTVRRTGLVANPHDVAPEVSFLNISVSAEYNNWEMTLFGRNITDERGSIRAGWTGLTSQARPRTIGVSVARQF